MVKPVHVFPVRGLKSSSFWNIFVHYRQEVICLKHREVYTSFATRPAFTVHSKLTHLRSWRLKNWEAWTLGKQDKDWWGLHGYLWKCAWRMMWSLWRLHSRRPLGLASVPRMEAWRSPRSHFQCFSLSWRGCRGSPETPPPSLQHTKGRSYWDLEFHFQHLWGAACSPWSCLSH